MKKLLSILMVLAITSFSVQAQVGFGLKAGLNISTVRGDEDEGVKSLIGANGGLFANIPAGTNFAVQPELVYSMEGAKLDGSDFKIHLDYVNIPLLAQYRNPSGFYAELGPQIGILTSAKIKSGGTSESIKDQLKSTNFSIVGGLGYNFIPSVGVNARYALGVSNISDDSEGDLKTSTFSIGLHYTFGK